MWMVLGKVCDLRLKEWWDRCMKFLLRQHYSYLIGLWSLKMIFIIQKYGSNACFIIYSDCLVSFIKNRVLNIIIVIVMAGLIRSTRLTRSICGLAQLNHMWFTHDGQKLLLRVFLFSLINLIGSRRPWIVEILDLFYKWIPTSLPNAPPSEYPLILFLPSSISYSAHHYASKNWGYDACQS